jgi:hypothetical protein
MKSRARRRRTPPKTSFQAMISWTPSIPCPHQTLSYADFREEFLLFSNETLKRLQKIGSDEANDTGNHHLYSRLTILGIIRLVKSIQISIKNCT